MNGRSTCRIFTDAAVFPADVRPCALGRAAPGDAGDIGLEHMVERHARLITQELAAPSCGLARVQALSPETLRYGEWQAARPGEAAIGLYSFGEPAVPALLRMEPRLVGMLLDRFYGGAGSPGGEEVVTAAGERLAQRASMAMMHGAARAWGEQSDAGSHGQVMAHGRETRAGMAAFAPPDIRVTALRFSMQMNGEECGMAEFLYPQSALQGAAKSIAAPASGVGNGAWARRMAQAARGISFDARVVIARPQIATSRLLALKAGDVIPVTIGAQTPLHVAGRRVATGSVTEADGRAAFCVAHMEQGSESA